MATKVQELHEKRKKALGEARGLVDRADEAKRVMNEDEERQYDAHMGDIKRFDDELRRETELLEAEKRAASNGIEKEAEKRGKGGEEPELRTIAFRKLLIDGINALSGEEARTLTTGSDTQAGFLNAPQEFVQQLIERVRDEVFIESESKQHTTSNANGLGFPSLETYPTKPKMITEIGEVTENKGLAFGKREFKPHLMKDLVKISDKMLRADGMNAEAIALDAMAYMIGITKEYMYLLGTGNQEPLGLFTASEKGIPTSRDMVTDMSTTGFTADALKNTKYSLKAQYMKTAKWLFHRDAVAKIAKLKDGDGRYMFEMNDKAGALDTLLGRPLLMSEYVPNTFTADKYVGMFGDLSKYWTVNALNLRIKRLNELFAATSEVGFLFELEFDGMPVLSEGFTRIKTAAS